MTSLPRDAVVEELESALGRPFTDPDAIKRLIRLVRNGARDEELRRYRFLCTRDLTTLILAMEELL